MQVALIRYETKTVLKCSYFCGKKSDWLRQKGWIWSTSVCNVNIAIQTEEEVKVQQQGAENAIDAEKQDSVVS